MRNNEEDSSSSENEISVDILKEAVDQQFFNETLYATKKIKIIPQSEVETSKLSPRFLIAKRQEDYFTNFGVSTTLQNFIAKKLSETLERSIELKTDQTNYTEQRQKRNKDFGIKLLSSSEDILTAASCVEHDEIPKKRKKSQQSTEDDDTLSKFQEAAVDPERILSKLDTKAWVNKRPEPEFKYKRLKDGTLTEIK